MYFLRAATFTAFGVIIPNLNPDRPKSCITELTVLTADAALKSTREIELLAFHRLGLGKYDGLGMNYLIKDEANLKESDCKDLAAYGREISFTVNTN